MRELAPALLMRRLAAATEVAVANNDSRTTNHGSKQLPSSRRSPCPLPAKAPYSSSSAPAKARSFFPATPAAAPGAWTARTSPDATSTTSSSIRATRKLSSPPSTPNGGAPTFSVPATGDAPGRALKAASVIRRTPASPSSVSGTSAPAAMPNPVSSIVEWTPQDFSAAKTAASHGTKSKASIAIPRASAGRPALAA